MGGGGEWREEENEGWKMGGGRRDRGRKREKGEGWWIEEGGGEGGGWKVEGGGWREEGGGWRMNFMHEHSSTHYISLKTKCAMCSDSCLAAELDHSLLCCTPVGSAIRWPWGTAEFTLLHCHHHTHTHITH